MAFHLQETAVNGRPPEQRVVQPRTLSSWQRKKYSGVKPDEFQGVINRLERGTLEDWSDLVAFMLRTDGHLASVYTTLLDSVAGAEIIVEPGVGRTPDEQAAAEKGAALWQEQLDRIGDLQTLLVKLLHAEGLGWAVAEHDWNNEGGTWFSTPRPVASRDIGLADDWTWRVRTFRQGFTGQWIRLDEAHPMQFMIHAPGGIADTPQMGGLLLSVGWIWLFKRWALLWQQDALERFATPHIIGRIMANAPPRVFSALQDAIENISAEHSGIVEGTKDEAGIEIVEPSSQAGDAWREAIKQFDAEQSKRLLGSTLNVEIGDTGGNRAAAESQGLFTILPRLHRIGQRLVTTMTEQWAARQMRLNTHRTDGMLAPTPVTRLQFVQEEPPEIAAQDVAGGLEVTVDEWRTAKGLEPFGGDRGSRIVQPVAKTQPQRPMASEPAPEVAGSERPFRRPRQLSLPGTRRRRSPTGSRSKTTQIATVPIDASAGRGR